MITIQYTAAKFAWEGVTRSFAFAFESIGAEALEVWLETETATVGVFTREKVPRQYYNVVFAGGKPTYVGGTVTLTGQIADSVDRISIERNTPITQVIDLKNFSPFHMPTLERMLDKLIMIIQELADRKCGIDAAVMAQQAPTHVTPYAIGDIVQPFHFDDYQVLSSTVVNTALEAVAFYAQYIFVNGGDCHDKPDES